MKTIEESISMLFHEGKSRIIRYPCRPMINFVGEHFKNKKLVGVEIGTYKGINAYSIMKTLNMTLLYCIDPYLEYNNYPETWLINTQNYFDKYELEAKKRLKKFGTAVIFIKGLSTDPSTLNFICDNLDFVYIDGNHDYNYAKNDINTYYLKLQSDGIIGGHNFESKFSGVARAVLEFIDKHNLELYGNEKDWWVIKK